MSERNTETVPPVIRSLLLSTVIVFSVAIFTLLCASVLIDSRKSAEDDADKSAHNVIQLMERDIRRTFEDFDLSVQGAINAFRSPELSKLSPEGKMLMLFDNSARAQHFSKILITDNEGSILFDSTSMPPTLVSIADRSHFQVHRDSADRGLFVSEPFLSRDGSYWGMAISRRVSNADGSFAGVVSGAVRLDYFNYLFSNLNVGERGTISLFHDDGYVVMRAPYSVSQLGMKVPNFDSVNANMTETPKVLPSQVDGIERRYVSKRIANLPMTLNVGISTADIYGPWRMRIASFAGLMIALLLSVVGIWIAVTRELLQRKKEATISDTEAKLQKGLAQIDGLTGVMNRRALDFELQNAWLKNQTSIACLMIDIDYFKRVNDTFGHQYGDDVLRKVAGVIEANIRKGKDFVGRYGGEEFCVILPETDIEGAVSAAEHIRSAVFGLGIDNPNSDFGLVTVSIGASAKIPNFGASQFVIVKEADERLYAAKEDGRNCVCNDRDRSDRKKLRGLENFATV